jgi:hypothetical protein
MEQAIDRLQELIRTFKDIHAFAVVPEEVTIHCELTSANIEMLQRLDEDYNIHMTDVGIVYQKKCNQITNTIIAS